MDDDEELVKQDGFFGSNLGKTTKPGAVDFPNSPRNSEILNIRFNRENTLVG